MAIQADAEVPKILLVCKGNICRSPAAETIMRALSTGDIDVRSRGTRSWHEGKAANEMMRSVTFERGYDLDSHVAHQITGEDIKWSTHILAFDDETIAAITQMFSDETNNKLQYFSADGMDILDPYGQMNPPSRIVSTR
jgi:protein-tyrosine phosphatase